MLGVRVVWTVHNLKNHEDTFRDLEYRFTKQLVKLSDRIVVHCKSAAEQIKDQFDSVKHDQLCIIPHGHFSNYYP